VIPERRRRRCVRCLGPGLTGTPQAAAGGDVLGRSFLTTLTFLFLLLITRQRRRHGDEAAVS